MIDISETTSPIFRSVRFFMRKSVSLQFIELCMETTQLARWVYLVQPGYSQPKLTMQGILFFTFMRTLSGT